MIKENTNDIVLGIEKSIKGNKWIYRYQNDSELEKIKDKFKLPDLLCKILVSRGIKSGDVYSFLNPTLKKNIPNPSLLKDMDKASSIISRSIIEKKKITILGDYDVDGATSSAVLCRYLRDVYETPEVYIPDRIKEGYGPNKKAIETIVKNGSNILITVDCGITSFESIDHAKKLGLETIVVDHHQIENKIPNASAVINPKREDDNSGTDMLAAVGVSFLLVVAINRELRNIGYFKKNIIEPDIRKLLDIVALGTVCDVVPIRGINRVLLYNGLKYINKKENLGITTLMNILEIDKSLEPNHLGYYLGPCINAGGRVGESKLGVKLLITEDIDEAINIANRLKEYNKTRKDIEKDVFNSACKALDSKMERDKDSKIIIAYGKDWHEGVIGIVASRLVEKYKKPALVISVKGKISKGSARSIQGFDVGSLIRKLKNTNILESGGGHFMAGGFTIDESKIEKLDTYIKTHKSMTEIKLNYNNKLAIDAITAITGANIAFMDIINKAGPYGAGNSEPRVVIPFVTPFKSKVVGVNHISMLLRDDTRAVIKAIAFKAYETALGKVLLKGKLMHVTGKLKVNEWQNKKEVQLQIEDIYLLN